MKIKQILSLLFISLFLVLSLFGKTIYVNTNITNGNNDGTSWQHAYSNFQNAISESTYGDTIWVAEGTYKPTSGSIREIPFILKNGVKWFGGFQGNETALSQRDYELYPTVLSGDIGMQGDSTDNSYHVVYSISSDTMTIIDGFLIKDGCAIDPNMVNGSSNNYGGGLFINASDSSFIAKPRILNCIFEKNFARFGGAISYGEGQTNFHINPKIYNCKFYQNEATHSGGALSIIGGSNVVEERWLIEGCLFDKNISSFEGGGVYLSELINDIEFLDCEFLENSNLEVNSFGGGVSYSVNFGSNLIGLKFSDCNFQKNSSSIGGAISVVVANIFAEGEVLLEIEKSEFINNFIFSLGVQGSAINYETFNENQRIKIKETKFTEHDSNFIINIVTSPVFTPVGESLNFRLEECEFVENESTCLRIRIPNTALSSKAIIANTVFKENNKTIVIEKSTLPVLDAHILNCIFFGNKEGIDKVFLDSTFVINISNTILWEDLLLTDLFKDGAIFNNSLTGYNIHHSLLKSPDCIIDGIDYCGDGMLYNTYPEFRDTLNNDFSLRSCSPAINQGDDLSIDTLDIFFDFAGNPRILDSAVDLGAYETQDFEVLVPQSQNVKCHAGSDGAITWVQHGTPPFTFEWDNGQTTGTTFTGLTAGNYSIAVMDADQCLDTFNMMVNQPLSLELEEAITSATGAMNADGAIEITTTGGIPDYDYLWSTGDTTAMIENLLPGVYTVTVIDANDCAEVLTLEVDFMTATKNIGQKDVIQLIPNLMEQGTPAKIVLYLTTASHLQVAIYNELGQRLFVEKIVGTQGKSEYDLPLFPSTGLFFVKVMDEQGRHQILKWIIQ